METLELKELTFKLVCLLALATAHRVQTLSLIKRKDISVTNDKVTIKITEPIKTSRAGNPQPTFIFPYFANRKEACVARVLLHYIEKTRELRGRTKYLFLTFKRPYHRATAQSISRWIKHCLISAGIDKQFTAHSTRHAATSMADLRGIDINIIKDTAGWSKQSQVLAKFYKREINIDKETFVRSILGDHTE